MIGSMDLITACRLVHKYGARVKHGPETIVEVKDEKPSGYWTEGPFKGDPIYGWSEVARSSDPLPFVDAVRKAALAEGWTL